MYLGNLKSVTFITFLQHFHNKSQVVSCYWFKFKFSTEITFFNPTITISNNLSLKICCKNVVDISFLFEQYKKSKREMRYP